MTLSHNIMTSFSSQLTTEFCVHARVSRDVVIISAARNDVIMLQDAIPDSMGNGNLWVGVPLPCLSKWQSYFHYSSLQDEIMWNLS